MISPRKSARSAKITDVHIKEAKLLREIWDSRAHESQVVFGEKYEIGNQAAVSQFLRGESPLSMKAAVGFARGLGCQVADFSPRIASDLSRLGVESAIAPLGEFQMVRHAEVSFSNGHGQVVYQEDDRPPLSFRTDFLRKHGVRSGDAVVVDAVGVSNEPAIPDGAVVLVNRGDRDRLDGGFFAFRIDGELLIKRLEAIPNVGILATAENSNFKPKQRVYRDLNPDQFEVIGRAVWIGATL